MNQGIGLHWLTPTNTGNTISQNKIFQLINFRCRISRRPILSEPARGQNLVLFMNRKNDPFNPADPH